MLNRVVLVGRLTRDPELRYLPSGVPVTKFTVAVNRPFTNQEGEREADFIPVVVWRKAAENCANFLSKGSLVGIDGRLQVRPYDKDGQRMTFTEVVADSVQFLEPRRDGQQRRDWGGQQAEKPSFDQYGTDVNPDDDEIPF